MILASYWRGCSEIFCNEPRATGHPNVIWYTRQTNDESTSQKGNNLFTLNSLWPTDACLRQSTWWFVRTMVCCIHGAKSLPKPILNSYQLDFQWNPSVNVGRNISMTIDLEMYSANSDLLRQAHVAHVNITHDVKTLGFKSCYLTLSNIIYCGNEGS